MKSDEREEEEIIFVELNGLIDEEWSRATGQKCKIIVSKCRNTLSSGCVCWCTTVLTAQHRATLLRPFVQFPAIPRDIVCDLPGRQRYWFRPHAAWHWATAHFVQPATAKIWSSLPDHGIDSDEPIFQLGRSVFSGQYKDTLGTKVLFECNSEMRADSTQSDGAVLDYSMCVSKVLEMQRVFLSERETENCHTSSENTLPSVAAAELQGSSVSESSVTMDTACTDLSRTLAAESDKGS